MEACRHEAGCTIFHGITSIHSTTGCLWSDDVRALFLSSYPSRMKAAVLSDQVEYQHKSSVSHSIVCIQARERLSKTKLANKTLSTLPVPHRD